MKSRGTTTRRAVAVACLALGLLSACAPPPPPPPTGHTSLYITRDGTDVFNFTPTSDGLRVVAAPGNSKSWNTRTLLWSDSAPVGVDQQICASFTSSEPLAQEGVALRASMRNHPGRAITVMKNIWGLATETFNVQLIDMSKPAGAGRITPPVPGVDYSAVLNGAKHWRLCARVNGMVLSFKVWPINTDEPAWGDTRYGRTLMLPLGWVYEGRPGIYAGHLSAGASTTASSISTTGLR